MQGDGARALVRQLQLRRYRSLHSRIHWRLHIDPLTPEDTAEYLRYRMKRAGCDRDVFTHDAFPPISSGPGSPS